MSGQIQDYLDKTEAELKEFNPAPRLHKRPIGPRTKRSLEIFGCVAASVLCYAVSFVFVPSVSDLFMPSTLWRKVGIYSSAAITITLVVYYTWLLLTNRIFVNIDVRQKIVKLLFLFVISPVLMMCFYLAITLGIGEITTEIFGQKHVAAYEAKRDNSTSKVAGKYGRVTAYCVRIIGYDFWNMFDEYCIGKPDYLLMGPWSRTVILRGKQTVLGTVVKGFKIPSEFDLEQLKSTTSK